MIAEADRPQRSLPFDSDRFDSDRCSTFQNSVALLRSLHERDFCSLDDHLTRRSRPQSHLAGTDSDNEDFIRASNTSPSFRVTTSISPCLAGDGLREIIPLGQQTGCQDRVFLKDRCSLAASSYFSIASDGPVADIESGQNQL